MRELHVEDADGEVTILIKSQRNGNILPSS